MDALLLGIELKINNLTEQRVSFLLQVHVRYNRISKKAIHILVSTPYI